MKNLLIIILLFVLVDGLYSDTNMFIAKVIKIIDGDTIDIMTNNIMIRIRLYGIDCPELDQPYGTNAQKLLEKFIYKYGKGFVTITLIEKDICRGFISKAFFGKTGDKIQGSLSGGLIVYGLAWIYPKYCNQSICEHWKGLQVEAKKKKIGLWKGENPIPPWEWRKRKIQKLLSEGIKLYKDGKKDDAIKLWRNALKLDPDNEKAEKYIRQVEGNIFDATFEEMNE